MKLTLNKTYHFRLRRHGTREDHVNAMDKYAPHERDMWFAGEVPGCGISLYVFYSVAGKYQETFTEWQIRDLDIREVAR